MQSLFWASAIYGGISLWLSYLKRDEIEEGMWLRCLAGYCVSRLFVWIQLKQIGSITAAPWLLDAGLFGGFVFLAGKRRGVSWKDVWLYGTNPVVFLSLSSFRKMTAVAGLCLAVLLLRIVWKRRESAQDAFRVQKGMEAAAQEALKKEQRAAWYRVYFAFTICGMLYLGARLLLGQSGSQCAAGDESYPMLWMLAVAGSAGNVVSVLFDRSIGLFRTNIVLEEKANLRSSACLFPQPEEAEKPSGGGVADRKPEQNALQGSFAADKPNTRLPECFSGRDLVFLFLFTFFYACLVFFRLGSMEAPQSYLRLSDASEPEREMIFQFGEEVALSKIELFLGVQSKRTFSFSTYNYDAGQWEVFDSKRKIPSVFTWNTIPVDRSVRALALVSMDAEAYIHEIVFLDQNGNQVLPVNWQEYEAVFDEQALYPETVTYYEGTMFDEVYHARTAYEFVHRLPLYEITHPPLGKLLISLGIWVFGMTPFGWRVVCALCGLLMVPLLYVFARKLTGQRKPAVFATALFCFEFMHLTLSRIATLDIIVALFVLGMFFWMYDSIAGLRREGLTGKTTASLFLCGGFSACAVAAKWTGFYAMAGIGILFLGFVWEEYASSKKRLLQNRSFLWKLFGVCTAAFLLLPAVVYVTSYIPYTWCGNPDSFVQIAADNFKQMLAYHQNTVFDHPYSSEWYEWLWNKRPLLDSLRRLKDGRVSSVATFGNPVIWWGGLASVVHNIYLWRCRQDKNAAYLCIAYLSMLLPWLFIYRTVFIYQYFICSNLLILLLANSFFHLQYRQNQRMLGFGLAAGVVFLFFFPVLTGYPVSADFINQGLEWLRSWSLA